MAKQQAKKVQENRQKRIFPSVNWRSDYNFAIGEAQKLQNSQILVAVDLLGSSLFVRMKKQKNQG